MLEKSFKIKIGIFFIITIMAVSFFSINWYVILQFRKQLNQQVQTLANIYHDKVTTENIDSDYLIKTLLPLIDDLDIPIIITTKQSDATINYEYLNLNLDPKLNKEEKNIRLQRFVNSMDKINKPLPILIIDNNPIIEIHFGDSMIIKSIKWLPYFQFSFAIIVLLSCFFGLRLLLSNEKNYIYAGMSRETAHQLGTPISSLMGWVELLNEKEQNLKKIIPEMKSDIKRLENISDKFNKIGSKPILKTIDISNVLKEVVTFFNSKVSESNKLKIHLDSNESLFVNGDKILLYWAIENIIKNALESIAKVKEGKIIIDLINNEEWLHINIIDNGPGISRQNKTKIFNPGFSTKTRGWGIGLNLSKRIIDHLHGGKLLLHKSTTKETVFRVSLKLPAS